MVWRVTNTKKIYRDVSRKQYVSVHGQGIEGRGEAGLAGEKHVYLSFTPCEGIWTTSGTYVSDGCGLHSGKRGGDASSNGKVVAVDFNRCSKMQHEVLLLLEATNSPLWAFTHHGESKNTYSRWKDRRQQPGSRTCCEEHSSEGSTRTNPFIP